MSEEERKRKAEALRRAHPDAAAFVDEVRKWFGPDVKVTYLGPRQLYRGDDPPAE